MFNYRIDTAIIRTDAASLSFRSLSNYHHRCSIANHLRIVFSLFHVTKKCICHKKKAQSRSVRSKRNKGLIGREERKKEWKYELRTRIGELYDLTVFRVFRVRADPNKHENARPSAHDPTLLLSSNLNNGSL